LRQHPDVTHIKIYDGRGKPLGRSFRVKLWPSFIFMRDGKVIQQMARPDPDEIEEGIASIVDEV
jgi:thioredoxin 1